MEFLGAYSRAQAKHSHVHCFTSAHNAEYEGIAHCHVVQVTYQNAEQKTGLAGVYGCVWLVLAPNLLGP